MDISLLFIKLFVVLAGTLAIIPNIFCLLKSNFDAVLFVYPIFYIFYILPLLLDILVGYPIFGKFVGLKQAFDHTEAHYIYAVFMLVFMLAIWCMFVFDLKIKQCKKTENFRLIGVSKWINFLMLLPAAYLVIKPVYIQSFFQGYAAQYYQDQALVFPELLTQLGLYGAVLYISSPVRNRKQLFWGILFAFLCVYLNGKKYLALEAVIYLFFAMIISRKIAINKALLLGLFLLPFIVLYLYIYIFMIKRSSIDLNSLMRLYFGRDSTVVAAISHSLTGEPIVEYTGQSILFYFFFFIPRRWFPSKPWPFNQYNARMCFGYPVTYLQKFEETVPCGIIAELVANFGVLFGVFFSMALILALIFLANRAKYVELKVFIITIIVILLLFPSGFVAGVSFTWAVLFFSIIGKRFVWRRNDHGTYR